MVTFLFKGKHGKACNSWNCLKFRNDDNDHSWDDIPLNNIMLFSFLDNNNYYCESKNDLKWLWHNNEDDARPFEHGLSRTSINVLTHLKLLDYF